MRQFSACLGAAAIFWALLTAPLFHFHDHDDHGNPTSLVHAHWIEEHETEEHHHADAIEAHGDHGHSARFVDVYTFSSPAFASSLVPELTATVAIPVREVSATVVRTELPRAHAPPELSRSIPRSPPLL